MLARVTSVFSRSAHRQSHHHSSLLQARPRSSSSRWYVGGMAATIADVVVLFLSGCSWCSSTSRPSSRTSPGCLDISASLPGTKESPRTMLDTQTQRRARASCQGSAVESGASSHERGSSSMTVRFPCLGRSAKEKTWILATSPSAPSPARELRTSSIVAVTFLSSCTFSLWPVTLGLGPWAVGSVSLPATSVRSSKWVWMCLVESPPPAFQCSRPLVNAVTWPSSSERSSTWSSSFSRSSTFTGRRSYLLACLGGGSSAASSPRPTS
ncbi:hypothetical protein AALO_G00107630 [Alosa alosa]|uniref:Uncharacterized protein n=1 Tax=Alosa alosa TaxID=278164 RepID=A0AAV6GQ99_9TELE|nr:hypothetical protein AALO_G00107630 [Alosa alosa]